MEKLSSFQVLNSIWSIALSYLEPGSDTNFLLWGVQIKGSDLALHLAVESGFPELLVGPDGMVLNASVGKLVHTCSQFLEDETQFTESGRCKATKWTKMTVSFNRGLSCGVFLFFFSNFTGYQLRTSTTYM